MQPESTYGKRLLKAAHEDFRTFWSGHRLWVTLATLVSPFLVQAKNHGWTSLLTLHETLESAAYALGLSLAGNCLIALWGGAKNLDAELRNKIQQRDPAEEHHFRKAQELVQRLSQQQRDVLKHLWTHGSIKGRWGDLEPGQIAGMTSRDAKSVLASLSATPLVSSQKDRDFTGEFETWEIPSGYKNALGKLLF